MSATEKPSDNNAVAIVADVAGKSDLSTRENPYNYYPSTFLTATSATKATVRYGNGFLSPDGRKRSARSGSKAKKDTEDYLQRTVWVFLSRSLPPDAVAWATPNDSAGGERIAEGARRKAMGRVAGIPDLFVLHGGLLVGIELKRPQGLTKAGRPSKAAIPPSDAQKAVLARLTAAGAPCRICRSIDEVAAFLEEAGIPLKTRRQQP